MGQTASLAPVPPVDGKAHLRFVMVRGAVAAVLIIGIIGIGALAYGDHLRTLDDVRNRLALAAEARVAAVQAWIARGQDDAHLGPRRTLLLMEALKGTSHDWESERTLLIQPQDTWIRLMSSNNESLVIPNPGHHADYPGSVEAAALGTGDTRVLLDGLDHTGRRVIALSRLIPESSWVLVQVVDRGEALADGIFRWRLLVAGLVLYLVMVGAVLMLVWKTGVSSRIRQATDLHQHAANRYRALSAFMDAVVNAQTNPVFVSEADGKIVFANRSTSEMARYPADDMAGRLVTSVLGDDKGSVLLSLISSVLETGEPRSDTLVFADDERSEQVWRTHIRPLPRAPEDAPAALVTVDDLSDLVRERRWRERNTERLIDTLVGLVDERDPDSAHQSRHVVQVARTIAEHMDLDQATVETVYQAARLVNIGKIQVPRALLTKKGPLTKEEMDEVRAAMDRGPDVLRDIEFDGPVLETLRQLNEWVDGSGRPEGLAGDQILVTAQITALANSFVAVVSPRAFRPGLSLSEADKALEADCGRRFDPRVVAALRAALADPDTKAIWAVMGQASD